MQSKLLLVQLEDVSLHSSTCHLRKEIDTHLTTISFQLIRKSSEDSSQPPFLQTKQPQFLQPFLKHLVFQSLQQFTALLWMHFSNSISFFSERLKTEHSLCGASLTSPISSSFWLHVTDWWFYDLWICRQRLRSWVSPICHVDSVERKRVKWCGRMMRGV